METYKMNYSKKSRCTRRKSKQDKSAKARMLRILELLTIILMAIIIIKVFYKDLFVEEDSANLLYITSDLLFGLGVPIIIWWPLHLMHLKVTGCLFSEGNEQIILNDKGFRYYYCLKAMPSVSATMDVEYDKIKNYTFDEETKWLDLRGGFEFNTYNNGVLNKKNKSISEGAVFFDVFDGISIHELLKEKVKLDVKVDSTNE